MQFGDAALQGALDLQHPERIVFEYPRAMIHLMNYNDPEFENGFVIGHGIGTIASHFADKRITVAEIDEHIVALSRKYFNYSLHNVAIGDGRQLLRDSPEHTYDYVVLDAFSSKGTPRHLLTLEFFQLISGKLDAEGMVIINLMGKGEADRLVQAVHATLGEVFSYRKSFMLPAEQAHDVKSILLAGSKKPIAFQTRHMAGFIEIHLGQGHIIMD
ncbi:spermidine synthase [Paenibacillaceae bacterium]|nr:spermidine synthase [Paenibacillaceae bacterium]